MSLFSVLAQTLLKTIIFFIAIVVVVELLGFGSENFISRTFISEVGFFILFFLVFIEEILFGMAKNLPPGPSASASTHTSHTTSHTEHESHDDHGDHNEEHHEEHDEHDEPEDGHDDHDDHGHTH